MNLKGIKYLKENKEDMFFLMAGPCVVEGREITWEIAHCLKAITDKYDIPFIFKASYRKANRSRVDSFTGIGDIEALEILQDIKNELKVPIITDIHSAQEAELVCKYDVDIIQIPAFLCRQTDIIEAAAKTGKFVNIKKGQFLAPDSMKFVSEKISAFGNNNIILTDRGTQFGYGDLIVDFRGIPIMKSFGHPVVLDVTHSLQVPNLSSGLSGGHPEMIETLAKAGIAVGCDGIFLETHPEPSKAKSDGANMLKLENIDTLLKKLVNIYKSIK